MTDHINTPPASVKIASPTGEISLIWHSFFTSLQLNSNAFLEIENRTSAESGGSSSGGNESSSNCGNSAVNSIESLLDSSGGEPRNQKEKTVVIVNTDSPYTVLLSTRVIFADTTSGAITLNLPYGTDGMHYKLINCGAGGYDLTVTPNGTEELYGGGAGVSSTLADGEIIDIHFNSTKGWY